MRPRFRSLTLVVLLTGCNAFGPSGSGTTSGGSTPGGNNGPGDNDTDAGNDNGADAGPGGGTGCMDESACIVTAENNVQVLAEDVGQMANDTGSETASCLANLNNLTSASVPEGCNPNLMSCALVECPGSLCWGGPYFAGPIPLDPWGNPYWAVYHETSMLVIVGSDGPDGIMGTSDDITAPDN